MGPKNHSNKHLNPSKSADRKHVKPQTQQPMSQPMEHLLPLELQQEILHVFRSASPLVERNDLSGIIREVKGYLYSRDFTRAFGKQDYLDAYALRWSASRAVAYAEIFAALDVKRRWAEILPASQAVGTSTATEPENPSPAHAVDSPVPNHTTEQSSPGASKVICIGGGAGAEVVALAAAIRLCDLPPMTIAAIDLADWSQTLSKLQHSLTTAPTLSAYASEPAKAANRPLIAPGQLHLDFTQHDVLAYKEDELRSLLVGASLVTLMFTLNELFTSSISRTTAFLLALTDAMAAGSWLLVVDSSGSYSEVKLGKDGEVKKYPMQWLLDHTLLKVAVGDDGGDGKWTKTVGEESKWFRIKPGMKHPVDLENMRYQMHLFRRQ